MPIEDIMKVLVNTFIGKINIFSSLISFIVGIAGSYWWIYKLGRTKSLKDFRIRNLIDRYNNLYVPLQKVCIGIHISIGKYYQPITLSNRYKKFENHLKKFEIKKSFLSLVNKYNISTIQGIEYGGKFPINEIRTIIENNSQWADSKLLSLLQRVYRAHDGINFKESLGFYQKRDESILTKEEFELIDYIFYEHDKLNKKLIH